MSTRCNIHFCEGSTVVANIYRHSDGYPNTEHGVLNDLKKFFKEVQRQTKDTRFSDASYLAAKFVVWQANENVKGATDCIDRMVKAVPDLAPGYEKQRPGGNLDFLSLGITNEDAGDGEYVYTVDCAKHDKKGYPEVTHRSVLS